MRWSQGNQKRVAEVFGPSVFRDLAEQGDSDLETLVLELFRAVGKVAYKSRQLERDMVGSDEATPLMQAVATLVEHNDQLAVLAMDLRRDNHD